MINFRYHVVSIVAIFLALGFGLLFGVTFLDQNVVENLQNRQDSLGKRNEELHAQNSDFEARLEKMEAFSERVLPTLVTGSLRDRSVLLVSFEETDGATVESAVSALRLAGAQIDGSVTLSGNIDLSSDERRRQAAIAVESASGDLQAVRDQLVARLTASLSGRLPGFLQRLSDAGLASQGQIEGVTPAALRDLPRPGSAVVVLPREKDRRATDENILIPLGRALSETDAIVAIAERQSESTALLRALRQDGGLRLVTVDGAEGPVGRAALALGLRAAFAGRFGHYGLGENTTAVIPEDPGP